MRNRILFLLCFLCVGLQAFAQISISGKVVDAGGLELPGVNVMVKGTTIGTLTDGDGKFTIPDVPGGSNAVLVSRVAGITGACHHAWLIFVVLVETGGT